MTGQRVFIEVVVALVLLVPSRVLAGIQAQGIQAQGIQAQGIQAQGIQAQGIQAQGISLAGTDVLAADFHGALMTAVDVRGTTAASPVEPHELTSRPLTCTGTGNHIAVGGGSAVGHYAVAHFAGVDGKPAEDVDLFIAGEQEDPVPNLFHRPDAQDNQSALYVVYFFHKWSGEWISLCPYNPATESASAMALPEDSHHPNDFVFACTATGVASKCARNWGYRPWASSPAWVWDTGTGAWREEMLALAPYYDACKLAARAAYCQDPKSFTKNGTMVDLYDTRQIIWPNAIENPWSAANDDSRWMFAQEYFVSFDDSPFSSTMKATALQRTRYRELSPAGECDEFAFIDRLEHDAVEDARWANPLESTPRIEVHSPTYCAHGERAEGTPLPWDCSPCTAKVCESKRHCCSFGADSTGWDHFCVEEAARVCQTDGVAWPPGRVWPIEPSVSAAAPPPAHGKYLLGPAGAVLRVDGDGASDTRPRVSGWACDPEWAGASIAVQIWSGPREKTGSAQLAEVRADRALVAPLSREVAAACDGPGRDYARHGFEVTLPAGQKGPVFAYAIDQTTADGPAAPPTLIRNGIVPLPSPAPALRPAPAAVITTGWIEAPTGGTYVFDASAVPSRLWINGKKLVDTWPTAGAAAAVSSPPSDPASPRIGLMAGTRYHLRWDRLERTPPAPAQGVTWQLPGAHAQSAIPAQHLYELAPGIGTGLRATYFDHPGFSGAQVTRVDETVDMGTRIVPVSPGKLPPNIPVSSYSAVWEGEVVPSFTEDYTFVIAGSGVATLSVDDESILPAGPPPSAVAAATTAVTSCPHDLCMVGDQLPATTATADACDPCVDQICARDPYCCEGGYASYYVGEPAWDAKCVTEVKAYCGRTCEVSIPNPVSPERKAKPIALRAGVHYRLRMTYENTTSDDTLRLSWASARQLKDVVPSYALYPAGAMSSGAGAGLHVTVFDIARPKTSARVAARAPVVAAGAFQLGSVIASGVTPDLSVGGPIGPTGTPVVPVIAPAAPIEAWFPSPPVIVRPRYDQRLTAENPVVELHGIGGVVGGSVAIAVQGAPDILVNAVPIARDGTFHATVPLGKFGARTLVLTQRAFDGPACDGRAPCAQSYRVTWPIDVTEAATAAGAPVITSPRDPTASPDPEANVFTVAGHGSGGEITVLDEGGPGAAVLDSTVTAAADGTLSGWVKLSDGATDPARGWHKLVFVQSGQRSKPVFVSVGIRPPTVDYPRSHDAVHAAAACAGATVDPTADSRLVKIGGSVRVPGFGSLVVAEEAGRGELALLARDVPIAAARADGSHPFETTVSLGYGKHLVHIFQVPAPRGRTSAAEDQAHLRAFATLAATPETRIVLDVPPPRLPVLAGASLLFPATDGRRKLHLEPEDCGPGPPVTVPGGGCNSAGCSVALAKPDDAARSPGCALPFADVNLRVGGRTYTTRAGDNGFWSLDVDLLPGWNGVVLSQVVPTAAGAIAESCPSHQADVGVPTLAAAPAPEVPKAVVTEATSPAGARVFFDTHAGADAVVVCRPPSGATFPVGKTYVSCVAKDPRTGGLGLARFPVTVENGAPVFHFYPEPSEGSRPPAMKPIGQSPLGLHAVPTAGLALEATGAGGAVLGPDVVRAVDAAHGRLEIACDPPLGAALPLDKKTTVTCRVTDKRAAAPASATFTVEVRDTTPPVLCRLPDQGGPSPDPKGFNVSFKTCADDAVDGSVGVSCDHPSGSYFPTGKTTVRCTAVDRHGNRSVPSTFTVRVKSVKSEASPNPAR